MKSLSDILTGPDKWCKKSSAADGIGLPVLVSSESACKFCIGGAITKMNRDSWNDECFTRNKVRKSIRKLFPSRAGSSHVLDIEHFNDHPDTTFEDVQKVIEDSGC